MLLKTSYSTGEGRDEMGDELLRLEQVKTPLL
jgi:hypothetical protein